MRGPLRRSMARSSAARTPARTRPIERGSIPRGATGRRATRRRVRASSSTALLGNVERVIQGKPEQIRLALVCLFAEGHLLIEDVPGVGKTSLAKAIARSIAGTWHRIQFTPDLLPSDVTGVSVWNRAHEPVRVPPRRRVRQRRARRRDQPGVAEDAVARSSRRWRSARSPSTRTRYRLEPPVHRHRDAEPDRARGHLPAARGPARPVPDAHPDGLPGSRARRSRSSSPRATRTSTSTTSSRSRPRPTCRGRGRHRSPMIHVAPAIQAYIVDVVDGDTPPPRARARREPTRRARAPARGARVRRERRTRLRPPRRREAPRPRGARAPPARHPRSRAAGPDRHRRLRRRARRACRSPAPTG